jgi:hypothetical protein
VRRIAETFGGAREVELPARMGSSKCRHKLPPEDATEDLDGEEEAGVLRPNPPLVIG